MKRLYAAALILIGAACTPQSDYSEMDPDHEPPPPPPWEAERLEVESLPAAYVDAWRNAENRDSCALLAFRHGGDDQAVARTAYFSGGWGVAFDVPGRRSAFGIAGTGSDPSSSDIYSGWPFVQEWDDGSSAGYGPEGGTGPNQLAYLRITGQRCLYNVWSGLGVDHLERLIGELRFVRIGNAGPPGT